MQKSRVLRRARSSPRVHQWEQWSKHILPYCRAQQGRTRMSAGFDLDSTHQTDSSKQPMSWATVNEAMTRLLVLGVVLGKSFWDLVRHTKTQKTAASLLGPCELHSKVLRTPPGTEQDQGSLGRWCCQPSIWCAAAEGRHGALSSFYKQNQRATPTCPLSHSISRDRRGWWVGWYALTHQSVYPSELSSEPSIRHPRLSPSPT